MEKMRHRAAQYLSAANISLAIPDSLMDDHYSYMCGYF